MQYDMKSIRDKMKPLHILIVDDEPEILSKLLEFMKKFCDNVDCASNGKEAFELCNANYKYDLVITDIQMPVVNGWELVQKLRSMCSDLFIVAVSGSAAIAENMQDMCDVYMTKPLSIDAMMNVFNKLIEKKGI